MIPQDVKENKPKILRRITFFLIIVFFGVIQNTGLLPQVAGLEFMPLLPLAITVSMFERETYGLNFGLLAGIIWDLNIASGDGFNALFLALTGFACGLLMTYLMMNNLLTAFLLCIAFETVHAVLSWFVYVGVRSFEGGAGLLWSFYLPSALLNVLTLPLFYYMVRAIMKKYRLMESEEI